MKRNGKAERRRRENRDAEGEDEAPQAPRSSTAGARIEAPKGWGVGRGCPPPHRGRGLCPSPEKKCLILALNMVVLVHSGWYFLQFSYLFYTQNQSSTAIGV